MTFKELNPFGSLPPRPAAPPSFNFTFQVVSTNNLTYRLFSQTHSKELLAAAAAKPMGDCLCEFAALIRNRQTEQQGGNP
jgi:hypothetical protein